MSGLSSSRTVPLLLAALAASCEPVSHRPAEPVSPAAAPDRALPAAPWRLTVGGTHGCLRLLAGPVRCWGANDRGQLGNGSTAASAFPVTIAELTGALEVAAGYAHSCARLPSGEVRCWGAGGSGQLGDGARRDRAQPVAVVGLGAVASLGLGMRHSCAVTEAGSIFCWGDGSAGQLGSSSYGRDAPRPVAVSGVTDALLVTGGEAHSCALRRTGQVICWGDSTFGQLGAPATAPGAVVAVPGLTEVVQLRAGARHTCAVTQQGLVHCWGFGPAGLGLGGPAPAGDGQATAGSEQATAGAGQATGIAVAAPGGWHTCLLAGRAGEVRCRGDGTYGQLGDGGTVARAELGAAVVSGAVELESGYDHSCALLGDGSVLCWGSDQVGQLSGGDPRRHYLPRVIAGLPRATAISAGREHSCALSAGGQKQVWCWGNNERGLLGDGTRELRRAPVPVAGLADATAVSCGAQQSCALRRDGAVLCWGVSEKPGELLHAARIVPLPLAAIGVSAGQTHNCALLADGRGFCWRLDPFVYYEPAAVDGLAGLKEIDAGHAEITCAVRQHDTVCLGHAYGPRPTGLGGLGDSVHGLSVGGYACGIEKGIGWCWGHGKLGSRRKRQWLQASPVALDSPRQLAAGDDHGCGLGGDGRVHCWGRNDKGQLGDGTLEDRQLPALVLGVEGAVQIAVGYEHSCALRRDGRVLCWGYNAHGELGPAAGDWLRPAEILALTDERPR